MQVRRWIATALSMLLAAGSLCARTDAAGPSGHDGVSDAERIERLESRLVAFDEQCEQDVLARGRALNDEETTLARDVGVLHPERVRILVSDRFPETDDPAFADELRDLGPTNPVAETTGYGIELKPRVAHSRRILLHELTHVGQFERLGVAGFIHAYLAELLTVGYRGSTLEAQANANERL